MGGDNNLRPSINLLEDGSSDCSNIIIKGLYCRYVSCAWESESHALIANWLKDADDLAEEAGVMPSSMAEDYRWLRHSGGLVVPFEKGQF